MPDAERDSRIDRPRLVTIAVLGLALLGTTGTARADRIIVRGGGQLKGKLIPDKAHPGQLHYIGEVGKTPMVFKNDQIIQVIPEKSVLDDYIVKLAEERTSAQAEYDLGSWCEENHLADLAQFHYELALKRDSTFESAHKKLGHVALGGRWLNADEVKEAQGMVKYKGRWMTPEEKERRELVAASAAEGNVWVKRLRALREAYLSGPAKRAEEAERRLLAIDEPAAVGPVLRVLGEDSLPGLRILAARVLASIPGPEAGSALVGRLLSEEDPSVRQATMNELARRESSEILPSLAQGLRSAHHEVINRTAWALGNLDVAVAVPKLIQALITVEQEVVMVDPGGPSAPGSGISAGSGPGFSSYSGGTYPVLTGPVVGPGVVAYGATGVPYGAPAGSSIGGGGGSGSLRGPVARLVQVEHRNEEVLAALVKLTRRDFGFDVATWKQWVATSFKVEKAPSRRVREP